MRSVGSGDLVRVHCTGKLLNGTVVQNSPRSRPLQLVAGGYVPGEAMQELSQAVMGMHKGERKKVFVPPERAYGPRNPGLQQTLDRAKLPRNVREGDQFTASLGGVDLDVTVRQLTTSYAVVDANHPLAGETLAFEIEIVSFISPKSKTPKRKPARTSRN